MDDDALHAVNQLAAHVGQLREAIHKLADAVALLSTGDSLEATNARSLVAEVRKISGG